MMRHLTHIIRALTALLAVAAFMVGVPAGLTAYVGWPLPTTVPSLDRIQIALRSGIDPRLLINVLAVIVWLVWAQLLIALAAEIVAAVRGRAARRLPLLPGLQPAVAQLVAAVTLAVATLGPLRAVPAAAAPVTVGVPIAPTDSVSGLGHQPPTPSRTEAVPRQHPEPHQPTYRVARHDTLWQIAESTLGDGRRWREIRTLNIGRIMGDGHSFTENTDRLSPGWELILPDDATPPDTDTTPPVEEEVTVKVGDSFWKIAETTLATAWGRPPTDTETAEYWRRLIDTNLHRLEPPYDPDLIYPDQRFELPPIPADPQAPSAGPTVSNHPEQQVGEITVEAGDSFWSIAEAALTRAWDRTPTTAETTDYWRQVISINRDRLAPPHDPNLIHPGQTFALPAIPDDTQEPPRADTAIDAATPAESPPLVPDMPDTETPFGTRPETITPDSPGGPVEAGETVTPAAETPLSPQPSVETVTPPHTGPVAVDSAGRENHDDTATLLPVASRAAGLGLLAAGLIALVDRLRRNQLRQRKPGTIPTPPPVTATRTEATLRAAAAPGATQLVDLALRALARQITDSHSPPPQVVGVHLSSDILRLLLWSPRHDPPAGWQVEDDGHSWTLPTSVDVTHLHLLADSTPAPYPALVTVGHDDDTQLLLDLEFLGAVQVTGDPNEVAATCYTMAVELAASPIADILEVVCVGFGNDLEHLERITVIDQPADILSAIDQKNTATATQNITPFEGRLAPWGGDTWTPLIILDPNTDRPQGGDRMLAAAHRGRAVCAVVGYPTGGRWRLHLTDGAVRVDPLGYTYKRRNLTPTEQADVADLTAAAKNLDGIPQTITVEVSAPHQPADRIDTPSQDADKTADASRQTSAAGKPTPELRTLGTVHIADLTQRFPQPKCLELVAYLAFHRHGVEADTLMEALYPEQPPNNHRLNDLMYRARRTLSVDESGELYLPHVTDNLYRISPQLGSDSDRLTNHIRSADRAGTETEAAEHLHAALEVVQGPPFSGIKDEYGWAHTEGIITHAVVTVDNAAHRLAQHALQADKPEQATWAARKGLTVSWACEECYRNLMRAAITQNNQTALDAIYSELTAIVDADQGPDATSWLDPETIDLYETHSRNRHRHTR